MGRLTFLQERYTWGARIFQSGQNLTVLADPAVKYNKNGLVYLVSDRGESWGAHIDENAEEIKGNPVTRDGYAEMMEITLQKSRWHEVVKRSDPVIGVHVSAGSPMDVSQCLASFEQAELFFPKYFPEINFKLFTFDTWPMDPRFQKILDPESNIVRFQKCYSMIPSPMDAAFVSVPTIFGAEALKSGF